MKSKNLLFAGLLFFLAQVIFSCSSAEYYRFAPTKQEAYRPVKAKPEQVAKVAAPVLEMPSNAPIVSTPKDSEPILEASVAAVTPNKLKKNVVMAQPLVPTVSNKVSNTELSAEEAKTLALIKNRLADLNKTEKKALKNNVKDVLQENASGSNILEIIFAIILPPVGVFLHEGITNRFWISLLLTLLFIVPGIIYALLVVTDTI